MRGLHCSINIYQEKSLASIFKLLWHKNQVFQVQISATKVYHHLQLTNIPSPKNQKELLAAQTSLRVLKHRCFSVIGLCLWSSVVGYFFGSLKIQSSLVFWVIGSSSGSSVKGSSLESSLVSALETSLGFLMTGLSWRGSSVIDSYSGSSVIGSPTGCKVLLCRFFIKKTWYYFF